MSERGVERAQRPVRARVALVLALGDGAVPASATESRLIPQRRRRRRTSARLKVTDAGQRPDEVQTRPKRNIFPPRIRRAARLHQRPHWGDVGDCLPNLDALQIYLKILLRPSRALGYAEYMDTFQIVPLKQDRKARNCPRQAVSVQ